MLKSAAHQLVVKIIHQRITRNVLSLSVHTIGAEFIPVNRLQVLVGNRRKGSPTSGPMMVITNNTTTNLIIIEEFDADSFSKNVHDSSVVFTLPPNPSALGDPFAKNSYVRFKTFCLLTLPDP